MRRVILVMLIASVFALEACSRSVIAPPPHAAESHGTEAAPMQHAPASLADWAEGAQLFDQLGDFHRTATTTSAEAQQYFDQGMRLLWAFNHDESTRSFARAAQLDSACAMCYWGVALTVGPNYNLPFMAEPRAKVAWEALQQAQQQAAHGSPVEQALIAALAQRYPGPQALDPASGGPVRTAYADAMREVAKRFPADPDVQTLFAEALMNVNAWRLWRLDGKPAPGTEEIVDTLERVLGSNPLHPGANHYYIHTMEASPHVAKAVAAAERLRGMMPGAGHLQHMPAHILQRVGRYRGAAEANREGIQADLAYLAKTRPLDYYGLYLAHNYQFLAYSAAMAGRRSEALDAARKSREAIPAEMLAMMPGMDWYIAEIYASLIRFGLWDEMLAEPSPSPALKALTGGYLYARAVAQAAKHQTAAARDTLAQLEQLATAMPADAGAGLNLAKDVLKIATFVAKAQIARAEGRTDEAISLLRAAAAQEDGLAYDEPEDWFIPVRHQLGDLLLQAGQAQEAEAVYREDLRRHPNNGWALYGLAKALRAQKKMTEAAQVDRQFAEAWKHADVTLDASVF